MFDPDDVEGIGHNAALIAASPEILAYARKQEALAKLGLELAEYIETLDAYLRSKLPKPLAEKARALIEASKGRE